MKTAAASDQVQEVPLYSRSAVLLLGMMLVACSRSPEAQRDKYLRAGMEHYARKDYSRALLAFRGASKAVPGDAAPWYRMGMTSLAMKDLTAAVEFFERALRLDPNHLEAKIELANTYVGSRDADTIRRGVDLAEAAVKDAPTDPRPVNILAVGDMRIGKPADAVARLEPLMDRFPAHLDTFLNVARARVMQGDQQAAQAVLERAIRNAPNDAKARFALGEFLTGTGNLAAALRQYEEGLQIAPDDGSAMAAVVALYTRLGQDDKARQTARRLAANSDAQFRFAYVNHLLAANQQDAAAAELTAMMRKDVADIQARSMLTDIYLRTGRHKEAEALLEKAVKENPRDKDALLGRAHLALLGSNADAAEEELTAALEIDAESADAHYLLSQVHRLRDRPALRQQELTETLRLQPKHVLARAELAGLFTERGDAKTAIALIDAAPEEQRSDIALMVQRTWALIELKDFKTARLMVDAMLTGASAPEALLQDAVLRVQVLDFGRARASLAQVLQQAPSDLRALELLARIGTLNPNDPSDLEFLRKHAAQHAGIAHVQVVLAKVELSRGETDRARAALESAMKADSDLLEAGLLLSEMHMRAGKTDAARTLLSRFKGGRGETQALRRLAEVEYQAGDYQKAAEHYRRVVEMNAHDVPALNNLAFVLAEHLKKPDEGLRYAQRAKELAPDDASVDDTLGWTYFRKGLTSAAVSHLESAVRRAPSARKRLHLGIAYAHRGDMRRAAPEIEFGLKGSPAVPEAELGRALLAQAAGKRATAP